MNLPVVIDIAIGLIFIYLILSLLASEIQEIITTLLQWRAKHLKKSVESLLAGGSETRDIDIIKAEELVKNLYEDPLINTLNHQAKDKIEKQFREISQNITRTSSKRGEKQSSPSYIPSETFAITLLEALKIPDLINHVRHPNDEYKTNLHLILSSYKDLKKGINNPESESYQKIREVYGNIDQEFHHLVNNLPDFVPDTLITSLTVIAQRSRIKVEDLQQEMSQFKNEIETWFDRSMDRASGVYKRNAKGVAILIGISVAILTNTDTFYVVQRLSQDSVIRAAITQSASQRAEVYSDPDVRKKIEEALVNSSIPIGWQNLDQQFNSNSRGWTTFNDILFHIWQVIRLIFGWTISGFAIAMGAPFWFDILNKVVNVRSTGAKPTSYTRDQAPLK
jgi:hypothetical protein